MGFNTMVEKSWLHHPVTLDEAVGMLTHPDLGKITCYRNQRDEVPKLEHMFESLELGDEMWWFTSNPERQRRLVVQQGFAVVRQGEIIDAIIHSSFV